MPTDPQGRIISDDGHYVWDGSQWIPYSPLSPSLAYPSNPSHTKRNLAIGCTIAFVILALLMGVCTVGLSQDPTFKKNYSDGYYKGYCRQDAQDNNSRPCPITPPPGVPTYKPGD